MIDGIHFIASNFGERILITSHVLESLERIKMDLNVHSIDSTKYIQATVTYEGYLTEWTLSCKDVTFTLDVSQKKNEVSGENKREPVHEKKQQKANIQIKKRLEDLTNDESEIKQIKKRVDDLTSDNSEISQIKKRMDYLTSDNSEISQIKKRVDDLISDNSEISQIKKRLEDLTNLFDNFKDEVISKLNELKSS
ncbi:3515_t:CDS:2 [Gigaspora margarita]|uniref:3515_t:CDS:1 n=1 Tax=Gigaspora margarita TaxID=4874 RepID=A0ABM8VXD9_GIGMA|nr:3515_t:CDS:2 [Gigaspora margarita]